VQDHAVTIEAKRHKVFDLIGKDAMLFHYASDDADETDETMGSQYVD
jgi:hypothetical protein